MKEDALSGFCKLGGSIGSQTKKLKGIEHSEVKKSDEVCLVIFFE